MLDVGPATSKGQDDLISRGGLRNGQPNDKALNMSARKILIHIVILVAVIVAVSAVAIWLNLGPVVY
jgi:hypothetical protein